MAITKIQSESLNLADTYNFTGDVTGAGGVNTPAFEAYQSADATISSGAATKVQCNTEVFDTAGNYDNSSNYRFTPTTSGKYFVYGMIYSFGSADLEDTIIYIYKNGSAYKRAEFDPTNSSNAINQASVYVSAIIDMNGSSDYVELYGMVQSGGTVKFHSTDKGTYFGAYKIIE
jgi:hypothetical protein|tara:strand:- start:19 stop:540 length:522 start_codon:yes stop_codon:yes gene_type:complete